MSFVLFFSHRIYNKLIWIGYTLLSLIWYFGYLTVANYLSISYSFGVMAEGTDTLFFYLAILFPTLLCVGIFYFLRVSKYLLFPTSNEQAINMMNSQFDKKIIKNTIKAISLKENEAYEKERLKKNACTRFINLIEG